MKLLRYIQGSVKNLDERSLIASELMPHIAKAYVRLNLITANDKIKQNSLKNKKGKIGIEIFPADLQRITSLLGELSNVEDGELPYLIKTNILKTLRYLLRPPLVFEFLRKEADFYLNLIQYCRDGVNLQCNRESWKTFYQIIFYHSGVLEYLAGKSSNNLLYPFLDLISTSYNGIVIMNGLRYIAKLFSMVFAEQKRAQINKPSTRNELEKERYKSYEKDVKTLNQVFVHRSLFIKIHMIYRRLITTCSGSAFLELANFYHMLTTSPFCRKFLKDTMKKSEYKQGLTSMNLMFYPEGMDFDPKSPARKKVENTFSNFSKMIEKNYFQ